MRILEQVSMDDEQRRLLSTELLTSDSLTESMIISTCNRVEIYAVSSSFHIGVKDIVQALHAASGVPLEELRKYLYVRYADAAAEHLLNVASGLDSMVVGEQQIIGQVRTAYQVATETHTAGTMLHELAQVALHTGKRVHTETDIDDAGASMVTFALQEAKKQLDIADFTGKTALVMGAGVMASLAATHLGKQGIAELVIANRTRSRAETLAEHAIEAGIAARVVDFAEREAALADVDIVVSATGADTYTITAAAVAAAGRPICCIDLSLPRDIDDHVANVPGSTLVNIELLHKSSRTDNGVGAQARAIVAEELAHYTSAQRVRDVAPAVSALRKYAAEIVAQEMARLEARTPLMADDDRSEVSRTVKRIVDKLLHNPTVRVKELAARSGTVSYDSAIPELFGLGAHNLTVPASAIVPSVGEVMDVNISRETWTE